MPYLAETRPLPTFPDSAMPLPLTAPLDLAATLDGGQAFRWTRDGEWWRGVLGETAVKLRLVEGALELASAPLPEEAVAPRLRHYLALDEDLAVVREALSREPPLAEALDQLPGLRVLRQEPWECLASFICSAECSIARIRRMVEALSRAFGQPLALDGHTLWTFPSAEVVAGSDEEALRRLGLGFRAPNLLATARRVAEGDPDLERLRRLPYEEAHRALLDLPGVGPKIADCALLFSLGKSEAFPLDRWVRRAVLRHYGLAPKTPDRLLTAWARERFGPHAGYAQQLLFHTERMESANTT